MTVQRPISPFELPYFQIDARFGAIPTGGMPLYLGTTVDGDLDIEILRAVLAELALAHPLLACGIAEADGVPVLRMTRGFSPRLTVVDGGEAEYLRLVGETRDWSGGLFGARVLRDGARSRVVLVVHHGIADGRSGFALLGEMWRRYSAHARAVPLPVVPAELPEAVDERLARMITTAEVEDLLNRLRPLLGATAARLPIDGTADDPLGRFAVERVELSAGETAAFVSVARAAGISVNSLLSGCAARTFRAQFDTVGPLPLMCGYAADLRGALESGVGDDVVFNAASGGATPLTVAESDDPIALGRLVEADVRAAVGRRDPARMALVGRHIRDAATATALAAAQPGFALSNIGRVPRHEVPEGLEVVRDDILAMGQGMPPKLTAFTLDDRLTVQVEYDTACYGRVRMSRVERALADLLRRTAARAPGVAVQ